MDISEYLDGKSSWHTEIPIARMPKQHNILEHLKESLIKKDLITDLNKGENFHHHVHV